MRDLNHLPIEAMTPFMMRVLLLELRKASGVMSFLTPHENPSMPEALGACDAIDRLHILRSNHIVYQTDYAICHVDEL